MGRQLLVAASAWALLSSACGASTEDEGKLSSAQQFPRTFAREVCASLARCCEHQSYELDLTQCERSLEADLAQELSEYDGLQVRFDTSAAESCIADYANAACVERPTQDYDVKRNCSIMFQGLVAPGGACRDSDECRVENGLSAQCLEGACKLDDEPPPRGELGAACGSTCVTSSADSRACEGASAAFDDPAPEPTLPKCFWSDGLQCSGAAGARKCQPLIAEGGSCAGNSQGCASQTFCDPETRLCRARTDSGPCSPERDACAANTACDFEAGVCVPVSGRDGTECEEDGDCQSGYCNPASVCQQPFSASFCAQPELD